MLSSLPLPLQMHSKRTPKASAVPQTDASFMQTKKVSLMGGFFLCFVREESFLLH